MTNAGTVEEPLLQVDDLHVTFEGRTSVHAVRGLNFGVGRAERFGLVGESGSGKSVSARSILGLTPRQARVSGSIRFEGRQLVGLNERQFRTIRGKRIALVSQDPLSSLNPVLTIGLQITEAIETHLGVSRKDARSRAVDLIGSVGIPQARERLDQYPHQLSGGMRQRVAIAIALCCEPDLLIADEPTTALDVTVQAQILELIAELTAQRQMSVLIITHDLGVVAAFTDRIAVMYAGRIVETGATRDVLAAPDHPYTLGLLKSVPRVDADTTGELDSIRGQPPSLTNTIAGCAFAPRCDSAGDECFTVEPPLHQAGHAQVAWCHRPARRDTAAR